MALVVALLILVGSASPALAQSAYIGGALIADVVRFSGPGEGSVTGSGEAIGGAIRVGVPLGAQWGLDLEFTRSGEIETQPEVNILATLVTGGGIPGFIPTIFPPPDVRNRQRLSTLASTIWWRHTVSERFDLQYLGGVAFNRVARELRIQFAQPDINLPGFPGGIPGVISIPAFEQESVSYGAGAIVGMDGRVRMTEHLQLVPGVRLQTVSPEGWVVRPAIGLHWNF